VSLKIPLIILNKKLILFVWLDSYQVQFGVLQAAQFGSPQARRRIIFAGTRHGLTAIKLPEPTHHYPDEGLAILLPTNDEKSDRNNGHRLVRADYRKCSSGALKAITIHDAISDLPEFEYLNPDRIMTEYRSRRPHGIRQNDEDQELITGRSELVPQLNRLVSFSSTLNHSTISLIGFDEFEYLTEPMNRYQSWLRKPLEWKPLVDAFIPKYPRVDNSDSQNAQQRRRTRHDDEEGDHYALGSDCRIRNWHVTPRFSAKVTERICNIPLKPNADHRRECPSCSSIHSHNTHQSIDINCFISFFNS
jgi:DNA (cytosine-5)-methyltransferase 1